MQAAEAAAWHRQLPFPGVTVVVLRTRCGHDAVRPAPSACSPKTLLPGAGINSDADVDTDAEVAHFERNAFFGR